MRRHNIDRRSIRDAVYLKNNPNGDPFCYRAPRNREQEWLHGMGLGLYWGEGTKACKASVRIGNSDPKLIKMFMQFMITFFQVRKSDFRFSLQLFNDIDKNVASRYWCRRLGVNSSQFTKPTFSPSQSLGTYKRKCQYGVLTLYDHNTRLRDLLINVLELSSESSFTVK
ncbi:MAG: hypothetical protein NUV81_02345 [bacterium]|nr:hypothetical protein [bacterium]